MTAIMSAHSPSLWMILSETWRIITAHPRHSLALSALFLLPVSFSAMVYPFLLQPTSLHPHYLQSLFPISIPSPQNPPVSNSQLLTPVLYILSTLIFSLCANPSITYSTFTAFYDKPVKFISSLESILVSFFPLLATLFITQMIMALVIFAFTVLMLAAYDGPTLLAFDMDYAVTRYFLVFVIVIAVILFLVLAYNLLVGWCLSSAVVVLESKWGLAALDRSSYLVKGMRKVVLSMIVLFGAAGGILTMWYSNMVANAGGGVNCNGWICVGMVVYVVSSTLLSLYGMVAIPVLFVYCKASCGEMALLVDEETGGEYVALPIA